MRGYCNMIGASDLETRHSTSGGKRMTSQGRDSLSLSVITRLLTSFFLIIIDKPDNNSLTDINTRKEPFFSYNLFLHLLSFLSVISLCIAFIIFFIYFFLQFFHFLEFILGFFLREVFLKALFLFPFLVNPNVFLFVSRENSVSCTLSLISQRTIKLKNYCWWKKNVDVLDSFLFSYSFLGTKHTLFCLLRVCCYHVQ